MANYELNLSTGEVMHGFGTPKQAYSHASQFKGTGITVLKIIFGGDEI